MTKYYLFAQRLMAEERNFTSSLVFHDSVQINLPPPEEDFLHSFQSMHRLQQNKTPETTKILTLIAGMK
jgi:hypothetical protein